MAGRRQRIAQIMQDRADARDAEIVRLRSAIATARDLMAESHNDDDAFAVLEQALPRNASVVRWQIRNVDDGPYVVQGPKCLAKGEAVEVVGLTVGYDAQDVEEVL